MKLYYLANVRLPTEKAHGIQIMKMCEAFANQHLDVELIVPNRKTPITDDPFVYYNVKNNFKIKRLWSFDLVRFGRIGFWVQSITFAEVATWYLLMRKGLLYTRDELLAVSLCSIGRRVTWEAHMGQKNLLVKFLTKIGVRFVVISHGLRDFYISFGVPENKIHVAPDAVDMGQFSTTVTRKQSRQGLDLPIDQKIVMYIGLLDEWKGYRVLLNASRYLEKKNIQVVVIGGRHEQIEELKSDYPHVNFLGYRPYNELPQHQKAANILVIPNSSETVISSYYTSPLKLFAHMASGVPIIASDLPSLREILDDSSAYFFKADDPKDLARIINGIFLEPNMAEAKARRAFEKVKNYSWNKRAENILKFIC
ncbi:MAG: glycosyltransferase family 4 protein [Patescibacteria group bacterium]